MVEVEEVEEVVVVVVVEDVGEAALFVVHLAV